MKLSLKLSLKAVEISVDLSGQKPCETRYKLVFVGGLPRKFSTHRTADGKFEVRPVNRLVGHRFEKRNR